MKKLNIAEILKDCPKGTKLYSPLCGECELYSIHANDTIVAKYINDNKSICYLTFNNNGSYIQRCISSECLLFPSKENRDWSTFHRPFKDGDIASTIDGKWVGIVKRHVDNACEAYIAVYDGGIVYNDNIFCFERFATEEEKQKLFDVIKANGYKWNPEIKTLEKLIEPKFKVGDRVLWNYNTEIPRTISRVEFASKRGYVYWIDCEGCSSGWWDETELTLIPNKFDITTLKPFDKVLVRGNVGQKWIIDFFGFMDRGYPFVCVGHRISQCIPYEQNEHLLNTINDCDEYYKIW